MYSQGGFSSRGKIPGPASKTLFRSITKSPKTSSKTSSSISNQGGSGMDSKKSRPLTFASAITDCWNSSNNNNSSSSSNYSENSSANGNQERTSCLFCCNLVIIPNHSGRNESNEKRSRMIKNLCFHMQLSNKDIPEECSKAMFPLCKVCEEFVKQLWDFQGMLDKIRLKMSKLVTKIERTVVDGEILNPKIDRNFSRQQNFTKLREMILQGYRKKLLVKQQIRENLVLGNPVSDFEPIANLKLEANEFLTCDGHSFKSSLSPSPSSCGRAEETVDLTVLGQDDVIEELDVIEEIEISDESSSSTSSYSASLPQTCVKERNLLAMVPSYDTGEGQQFFSQDVDDYMENEQDDNSYWEQNTDNEEVVTNYNENNCTLVISNIHGSDGASFTAEAPSLVQIKQEMHNHEENEEEVDVDVEGNDEPGSMQMGEESDDDIYMLEPRKRRLLFEGVEIYKLLGKNSTETGALACSLCSFSLENPRRAAKGDVTAYTKLKIHIQTVHQLSIPTRVQTPSKRSHGCRLCNEISLTTRESRRTHETAHSPPQPDENTVECDICGRRIKSGSEFNLLLHKFSHKNDEERRLAIAAKERGTSNALLSKRIRMKKSKKAKSKSRRSSPHFGNTSNGDGSAKEICEFCSRTFTRKCYLTLHMRVHSSQKRWPNMNVQGQQDAVGDSGPPILQPQQVPVITYPPAQKKSKSSTSNATQTRTMEEFCDAIGIVRVKSKENRDSVRNSTVEKASKAPILKREVAV